MPRSTLGSRSHFELDQVEVSRILFDQAPGVVPIAGPIVASREEWPPDIAASNHNGVFRVRGNEGIQPRHHGATHAGNGGDGSVTQLPVVVPEPVHVRLRHCLLRLHGEPSATSG